MKTINLTNDLDVLSPKITLINGAVLKCYLREEATDIPSSELSIDKSGEYLSSCGIRVKQTKQLSPYECAKPMLDNIALILDNAERILSDSRMFLAPLQIQNGFAYTGISGFLRPTLGVYVEWWKEYYKESHDKDGNPIWFISGSPLSGCHACSSVLKDGSKTKKCDLQTTLLAVGHSFATVNNRYNEAKAKCCAYTFDQVIEILRNNLSSHSQEESLIE